MCMKENSRWRTDVLLFRTFSFVGDLSKWQNYQLNNVKIKHFDKRSISFATAYEMIQKMKNITEKLGKKLLCCENQLKMIWNSYQLWTFPFIASVHSNADLLTFTFDLILFYFSFKLKFFSSFLMTIFSSSLS